MKTKSIEKQPMVIPGEYKGIWSAYYVRIIYHNGNQSEPIEVSTGIRGVNCSCKITVEKDGNLYVNI